MAALAAAALVTSGVIAALLRGGSQGFAAELPRVSLTVAILGFAIALANVMAVYFWLDSALHAVAAACRSAAIAAVTLLAGVVSSSPGAPFVPLIAMTVTATLMTHYALESDWIASLEVALFIPIVCITVRLFWRASETTLLRNLVG